MEFTAPSPESGEQSLVAFRIEAHQQRPVRLDHRAPDHRRLPHHQPDGLVFVQRRLVGIGKLAKGRAGAVQQLLPAELATPPPQPRLVDTRGLVVVEIIGDAALVERSEEHTSELQSLMRISYAVFCLKKKTNATDEY